MLIQKRYEMYLMVSYVTWFDTLIICSYPLVCRLAFSDYLWNCENDERFQRRQLTTKQKRILQEIQIATMDTFPIVSPNMFEALNLSDDQRGQLDKIEKDLEPDFVNMNGFLDAQIKMMNKISEYQDREDIDLDWSKSEAAKFFSS